MNTTTIRDLNQPCQYCDAQPRERCWDDPHPPGFFNTEKEKLFIVRSYDGFDNVWIDITGPINYEEAKKVWNNRTSGGTKNKSFYDIDYCQIFPADTRMLFDGKER